MLTNMDRTLTPQRKEVLRLLRAKMSPREIAAIRGCTTQNVYQHLKGLRKAGYRV